MTRLWRRIKTAEWHALPNSGATNPPEHACTNLKVICNEKWYPPLFDQMIQCIWWTVALQSVCKMFITLCPSLLYLPFIGFKLSTKTSAIHTHTHKHKHHRSILLTQEILERESDIPHPQGGLEHKTLPPTHSTKVDTEGHQLVIQQNLKHRTLKKVFPQNFKLVQRAKQIHRCQVTVSIMKTERSEKKHTGSSPAKAHEPESLCLWHGNKFYCVPQTSSLALWGVCPSECTTVCHHHPIKAQTNSRLNPKRKYLKSKLFVPSLLHSFIKYDTE